MDMTYRMDMCTWFVWSADGDPCSVVYACQPIPGNQICLNQMTYNTPRRSALPISQPASLLPYVREDPVATPPKPPGSAAQSQARPRGCSPHDCCRQQCT